MYVGGLMGYVYEGTGRELNGRPRRGRRVEDMHSYSLLVLMELNQREMFQPR